MKRILSFAALAVFVFAVVLSGCSQPAAQDTDAGGGKEAVSVAENSLQAGDGSIWAVASSFKIAHATNYCGFLDEKYGVTVGYAGEAHYTSDGGKDWPQAQNASMCLFSLDFIDSSLAWAAGNGNNVRMSSDGGKTWAEKSSAGLGSILSYTDFVDDKTGWVANLEKLAATKDGAQTWTEVTLPGEAQSIAAIALRTPECGYVMTHSGLLFTTKDGGSTWSKQDLSLKGYGVTDMDDKPGLNKKSIAVSDISFTDENNGTIVFSGLSPGKGFITVCLVTSDGGASWEAKPVPDVGFSVKKVFLTADGKYLTLGSDDNRTAVLIRQE